MIIISHKSGFMITGRACNRALCAASNCTSDGQKCLYPITDQAVYCLFSQLTLVHDLLAFMSLLKKCIPKTLILVYAVKQDKVLRIISLQTLTFQRLLPVHGEPFLF